MDSTTQTAPGTHIMNGTGATGDAWIRQREQPLGTHKSSTNSCHG
jgi:hypothetical protein